MKKQSKAQQNQSVSSKSTSFSCNLLGETHTITFFHQEIAGKVRALRGDGLALLCFFHQEIAGDGRALRGDQLSSLSP